MKKKLTGEEAERKIALSTLVFKFGEKVVLNVKIWEGAVEKNERKKKCKEKKCYITLIGYKHLQKELKPSAIIFVFKQYNRIILKNIDLQDRLKHV